MHHHKFTHHADMSTTSLNSLCMYVCMVLIQWFELQPNRSESFVGTICNVTMSVRPLDMHFHSRRNIFCHSSLYFSPWTCSHLIKTMFVRLHDAWLLPFSGCPLFLSVRLLWMTANIVHRFTFRVRFLACFDISSFFFFNFRKSWMLTGTGTIITRSLWQG